MLERLTYRFTTWAGRYGEAAPAACCGVCKPCVTTAAAGLVAGAAGLAVQAVGERLSDGDEDALREAADGVAEPA